MDKLRKSRQKETLFLLDFGSVDGFSNNPGLSQLKQARTPPFSFSLSPKANLLIPQRELHAQVRRCRRPHAVARVNSTPETVDLRRCCFFHNTFEDM